MNGNEEGIDCGGDCPKFCKTFYYGRDTKIWYNDTGLTITLAPNPVHETLAVTAEWESGVVSQTAHKIQWDMCDIRGTHMASGEFSSEGEFLLDVSRLLPQMYLVRFRDSDGSVVVQRFLKQE